MAIDAKLVAELRRRTGLPMMKCKAALTEADGDIEAAADNLRKLGLKTAEKVKDRTLKEGLVFRHATPAGAAVLAVLCETDFVARSEDFAGFGEALVKAVFENAPGDTGAGEDVASLELAEGKTARQTLDDMIAKIRENIQIGPWARFRPEQGVVATYVHHNSKIAALVDLAGENLQGEEKIAELGKDLGMQIAFHADVQALHRDELDAEWVAKEREVF